ncbi:MAG: VCBS repeat-containing protein [Christensenellaceae bacterium]
MRNEEYWQLTLMDSNIVAQESLCLAADDVDNDGCIELILGNQSDAEGLICYKPDTNQRITVLKQLHTHVGIAMEDIDGDGINEVVIAESTANPEKWDICWYKPENGVITENWNRHLIVKDFQGGPHDIVFCDIDGDGIREMITIACYTQTPGIFIFKPGDGCGFMWHQYTVCESVFTEGISVCDINSDGKPEIISGPDIFFMPIDGPYEGLWTRENYAQSFREMCRTTIADITGNGQPDIIIVESEYMDGRLAWFENKLIDEGRFVEHIISNEMVYAHTLQVVSLKPSVEIIVAEMSQGGWDAPFNDDAHIYSYTFRERGRKIDCSLIAKGDGINEGIIADIDKDGQWEIYGKSLGRYAHNPKLHCWKKLNVRPYLAQMKHKYIDRDKHDVAPFLGVGCILEDESVLLCGNYIYLCSNWKRFQLPPKMKALITLDVDNDRQEEIISQKETKDGNQLVVLKTSTVHSDGQIVFNEVCTISELKDLSVFSAQKIKLKNGYTGILCSYESKKSNDGYFIDLWQQTNYGTWVKNSVSTIPCHSQICVASFSGAEQDFIAGSYIYHQKNDGIFEPMRFTSRNDVLCSCVCDFYGNGDNVILATHGFDNKNSESSSWQPLGLYQFNDQTKGWTMQIIDWVRNGRALCAYDVDGDGQVEVFCGEHAGNWAYRTRSRFVAYHKVANHSTMLHKYILDDRNEHSYGLQIVKDKTGKVKLVSHGESDNIYLNCYEREEE